MNILLALLFVGLVSTGAFAAPPASGLSGGMPCFGSPCDFNSGPVCVVDDSGVPMTFSSSCMAEIQYCRFGIYYAVVKHGEC